MTGHADEFLQEVADALKANGGNISATARQRGVPRPTLQSQMRRAVERGFLPPSPHPLAEGFVVKSTTQLYDGDGTLKRQKIATKRDPGPVYETKPGHRVMGESVLVDEQGREIQKWVKTKAEDRRFDLVLEQISAAFENLDGGAGVSVTPEHVDEDLLTVYPVADHHLGLFSWAPEAGNDYDLKIGADLLRDTMRRLVKSTAPSSTAVILSLGDFFHLDNSENRTRRSGNALDVDTRYAKVIRVGVEVMIECIEMALKRHRQVIVRIVPGNHDDESALALAIALAAFYSQDPRVDVDCDPSRFFFHRFGKVLIGATHGDTIKPENMPGTMAASRPEDWGRSLFRYFYFGHIHHRTAKEIHGVVCESFQTLAARDAWHAAAGYVSGRSMTSITHHSEHGECQRNVISIPAFQGATGG